MAAVSPTASDGTPTNGKVCELERARFLCAWVLVVGLHCICAVFLTTTAKLYWFLTHPYMEYWANLIASDRRKYFRFVAVCYGLASALHWWQLLRIMWTSLRARELVLLDGNSGKPAAVSASSPRKMNLTHLASSRLSSAVTTTHLQTLALPSRILWRCWRFLFSRHGVFGVESDLFPIVFTIREIVEIVSQTFQAHRSSKLLPRVWVNNLLIALVITNCWSTPVIQRLLRHHPGMERVVCLVLDVLLNMGSSILIPAVVFLPYYEAYIPEYFSFSFECLYDALWFSRLVMENQLLFAVSIPDFTSKMIPHLGIYSSLASAATLIRRKGSRRQSKIRVKPTAPSVAPVPTITSVFLMQNGVNPAPVNDADPAKQASAVPTTRRSYRAVHLFFFAWGLVLLILHVRAVSRSRAEVLGCRQVTGSWFATEYPCSVYAYNCYRQGMATPNETSMSHLDQSSLVYLTLSHCSELKVPHQIQDFPNLLGFQLHNTTIVEWSKENCISATKHTKMLVIVIAKTNMTGIPDGMLEPLPDSLMDIEMTYTNLTTLPIDLHEKWHPLVCMYLEHSLLTQFPEALMYLEATELSLHGNLIETLPELTDKHQYFYSFVVSANPLRELPETLGDGTAFGYLSAENTQLAELPAWTHINIESVMYLHGTPYCGAHEGGGVFDGTHMACGERDNRVDGKCAIGFFDPKIPL